MLISYLFYNTTKKNNFWGCEMARQVVAKTRAINFTNSLTSIPENYRGESESQLLQAVF